MQGEQTSVMSYWTSLQYDTFVEKTGMSAEYIFELAAQAWILVTRNSHWDWQWGKMESVQVHVMNWV